MPRYDETADTADRGRRDAGGHGDAATAAVTAQTLPLPRSETMTWKLDGETRRAVVYAPENGQNAHAPLVFSFHGHGDSVQNFQYTNLHLAWPDAIVVYFEGLPSRR